MSAGPARERPAAAAIAALAGGGSVVLLDDEGVGHLLCDGRAVDAEQVVAMLDAGGGIFSVVLAASRVAELRLHEQSRGTEAGGRRIAGLIDARVGTTTGISAAERANTVRVAADPSSRPGDLIVPGHVPPLIAADAGVFAHRAAPEAALDLVRLADGSGAAAICAILDEGGRTAPPAQVRAGAEHRGLPLVTITDVAARRIADERPLSRQRRERLVTHHGSFSAVTLSHDVTGESHLVLVRGTVEGRSEVPVALHSSSPGDELLGGLLPGGESRLAQALRRFASAEAGILVHLGDRDAQDPRALDLAATALLELAPASVLPLDPALAGPLRDPGIEVAPARTTSRPREPRHDRCDDFGYEVDMSF
jgi:3,4-dihydroxy 2-butanone 4-phosphate synthase/GTP cyclohydrolase II